MECSICWAGSCEDRGQVGEFRNFLCCLLTGQESVGVYKTAYRIETRARSRTLLLGDKWPGGDSTKLENLLNLRKSFLKCCIFSKNGKMVQKSNFSYIE